jgi:hypothetical protein
MTDRDLPLRAMPMNDVPRAGAFTIALAALGWFSVLLQLILILSTAKSIGSGIVTYLGYFTILTNLLVCVSLTMPLIAPASSLGKFFSRGEVMAGVAASIVFVGISFHILLRNVWHPQGLDYLTNLLLHYIMPSLYLLYWWWVAPKGALRWIHPVIWGVYPTAYLIYALIRGAIIGSYPYGFIDAGALGYRQTLINGVGLLVCFIALGLLLVASARLSKKSG